MKYECIMVSFEVGLVYILLIFIGKSFCALFMFIVNEIVVNFTRVLSLSSNTSTAEVNCAFGSLCRGNCFKIAQDPIIKSPTLFVK